MQKALVVKAVVVASVFAVLQIPLLMIHGLVYERGARHRAVVEELSRSSYGRQAFAGPVLLLPYTEIEEAVLDGRRVERHRIERVLRLYPDHEAIESTAGVEIKSRGLFKARVFDWHATLRGEFVLAAAPALERARPDSRVVFGTPLLAALLTDPRGLGATPTLDWNGANVALARGSGLSPAINGVHAALPPIEWTPGLRLPYALSIAVHGTESLSIVPLAADTRVHMQSAWPHPSFGGQFLPSPEPARGTGPGFDARWTVSALASSAQQQLQAWIDGVNRCADLACVEHVEVRFIEPIDIYALSDRAVKYGFLFIASTFACFLLFELLKRLRIHPAQYLLVGLALATFFLLLLGLSEHIPFAAAYLVAAAACIALLGYYLSTVLGSVRRGLSFAVMVTALYGALYGLLVSEDNALLLGSLLVFALVAAAMILTRELDWYNLDARAA